MHEALESPLPLQDTAAIFLTHVWEERLEIIRHLVDHSRQILLILGEEGSGKSTLRGHLAQIAPAAWRAVAIDAVPFDDAVTLLERLAAGLGLTLAPKANLEDRTQALQDHLEALQQTGVLPVALIDDAHQLPADALLLLLRFATLEHAAAALRVVLFCDPRITRLLESPQLLAYQRTILHTVEMPAYTEEETAAFLVWRYSRMGRDPGQLGLARVRAVHQAAQGLPGRIQALDAEPRPTADVQAPPDAIIRRHSRLLFLTGATLLLALLVVLAAFVWRESSPPEKAQPPMTVSEIPPVASITAVTAPASATTPNAPMAIGPRVTATEEHHDNEQTTVSPPPLSTAARQAAPIATAPTPPPPASAKGTTSKQKKTVVDSTSAPRDGNWLRQQPQDRYVIQLFGSHDQSAALKYAERPELAGHTAIYTTLHDQQLLYVVVYGLYASRAEAVSAIGRLPAEVVRLKPFPRSVGEVHQLMTVQQ